MPEISPLFEEHGSEVLDIVFYMSRTYAYGLHRKKLILIGKWPYSTRNENCYNTPSQTNSSVVSGSMREPEAHTSKSRTINLHDRPALYCDQLQASHNSDRQLVCDNGGHDQLHVIKQQSESLSVARLHHHVHGHVHPSHGPIVSSDVHAGGDCGLAGSLVMGRITDSFIQPTNSNLLKSFSKSLITAANI